MEKIKGILPAGFLLELYLFLILILVSPIISTADSLDHWHWRNTYAQSNGLYAITYGNNTFVTVGLNGTILTSNDGINWTTESSGTKNDLNGITYVNNTFVAVGSNGNILTSADGMYWTTRSSGSSNLFRGITSGNNTFVAAGDYGTILTSANGMAISGTTNDLIGITHVLNTFFAVGDYGTILTSSDGMTWTARSSGTSNLLRGIAYGNNTIIAVGSKGTILTSGDGINWITGSSGTASDLNGIAYVNDTFFAVGDDGTILTSGDGINWTARPSGTSNSLRGITYGSSTFVAVGEAGTIITSADGINWTTRLSRTPGTLDLLNEITYGSNTFVAVGNYGTILTSGDGIDWTSRSSGTSNSLSAITYGDNTFVTAGSNGSILSSGDGITWTASVSGTSNHLYGIAYGGNIFVAVGGYGTILTSADGLTWTASYSGTSNLLYGITYGGNTFVAVGEGGTVITSSDGLTWAGRSSGTSNYLIGVTYGNNTFVAVGFGGIILTSPDGLSWTTSLSGTPNWWLNWLLEVTYGNDIFVAVGTTGRILTSPDGLNWTSRIPVTTNTIMGVTFGSNTFVVVGDKGTIIQSESVVTTPDSVISISQGSVNFGNMGVGFISPAQTFTISNSGNADLLLGTITLTSATFDFIKEDDNCSGQTIPPWGACTLRIIFSPASDGKKSATLTIPSNDLDRSDLSVPLRGLGVVPGDLDGDGKVSLEDAIVALQVLAGYAPPSLRPDYAASGVDIDGDNKIGWAEAIFILQLTAGWSLRPASCPAGAGASGTPAEQAACYIALLASPDTRLSGWLGLYDALGIPVLQDGTPIGSTGDDPIGPHYWQIWYASAMDLPGRGIPLSDAGSLMAVSLSDPDIGAYGPILLNDLRLAARSSDPQVRLLGLFVRQRILRGPSHVDILDPAVTPAMAVIDLPTLQLLGWIAMRGAMFQEASTTTGQAPHLSEGLQPAPKNRFGIPIADLKCSDLSNDYTTWANWLINKIGGGFQLPGMANGVPGIIELFQKKYLQSTEEVIAKTNKATAALNLLASAIGAGLQYLAMYYTALQDPDPLERTKGSYYDGNPGVIALKVEYNLGKIPDGDSLTQCYISFVSNALGVSIGFPAQGPIPYTEIFIEKGQGIPDLVLFNLNQSSQTTPNRVQTGADGQANIRILGRRQIKDLPEPANPVMKEFSIIVSAQPEEAGLGSITNIFFDAMSAASGGGAPAALSALIGILKTTHWKEQELVFRVQDWTTEDTIPPSIPEGLTVTAVSKSQLHLTWSASTDNVGVTGYNIYRGGKYLKSTTVTELADAGLAASTIYCYQITAYDAAENESDRSSRVCARTKDKDDIPPAVVSTSPAAGATNADIIPTIVVKFSEAIDPATITTDALTVSHGQIVSSAYYHSVTNTAEFRLSANLASNTEYTATVNRSVRDVAGNAMAGDYSWTFRTGEEAPVVLSTSPSLYTAGVPVDTSITATFNKTMDFSTITPTTFNVSGLTGIVTGSSTTAVFMPSNSLNYDTTYTATITTGVRDTAGINMASPYTWTFTTVAAKKIADLTLADIPDPGLLACVQSAPHSNAVYVNNLQSMSCFAKGISNLSGIDIFTNLTGLMLGVNRLADLSPVAKLTKLKTFWADQNQISDLSPLAGLTNLTNLKLQGNRITNVEALAGLTKMEYLDLDAWSMSYPKNAVTDISPLAGLTKLKLLDLDGNKVSNLAPLAGLTNLTNLQIAGNSFVDVSPLVGLINLTHLYLYGNKLVDVSPLVGLTNLRTLDLMNSLELVHVLPLAAMTNLTLLNLTVSTLDSVLPNIKLSCSELTVVINTLGSGVVFPNAAIPLPSPTPPYGPPYPTCRLP